MADDVTLTATEYDRYRSNIEHEDDLINHRLSWLLIAQSFLLGACVAAANTPIVVRVVGIATCATTYISLLAAIASIRSLRRACQNRIPADFPSIVGDPPLHTMGLVGPLTVPIIFVVAWLLL